MRLLVDVVTDCRKSLQMPKMCLCLGCGTHIRHTTTPEAVSAVASALRWHLGCVWAMECGLGACIQLMTSTRQPVNQTTNTGIRGAALACATVSIVVVLLLPAYALHIEVVQVVRRGDLLLFPLLHLFDSFLFLLFSFVFLSWFLTWPSFSLHASSPALQVIGSDIQNRTE